MTSVLEHPTAEFPTLTVDRYSPTGGYEGTEVTHPAALALGVPTQRLPLVSGHNTSIREQSIGNGRTATVLEGVEVTETPDSAMHPGTVGQEFGFDRRADPEATAVLPVIESIYHSPGRPDPNEMPADETGEGLQSLGFAGTVAPDPGDRRIGENFSLKERMDTLSGHFGKVAALGRRALGHAQLIAHESYDKFNALSGRTKGLAAVAGMVATAATLAYATGHDHDTSQYAHSFDVPNGASDAAAPEAPIVPAPDLATPITPEAAADEPLTLPEQPTDTELQTGTQPELPQVTLAADERIWDASLDYAAGHEYPNLSETEKYKLVDAVLKMNHLSWEDARHLGDVDDFSGSLRMPTPEQLQEILADSNQ